MKAIYLSFICLWALFSSAAFSATIAQNHQVKGLSCEGCHSTMPMADYNKCIACHGGKERLAASNPQHSAFKTAEVPCSVCHKGHTER